MDKKWVAIWGNSLAYDDYKVTNYAKNVTVRYVIKPLISGNKIKIKFSNASGYESVVINKISVAKSLGEAKAIDFKTVTFDGKLYATIKEGDCLYSDPIDINIKRNEDITVSFYLESYTDMFTAVATTGPLSENHYFARGDYVFSNDIPLIVREQGCKVHFLDTVEVYTEDNNSAIVVFGDSITAQSWPEWLSLRMIDEGIENRTIIRRAVGGSRVLRQYECMNLKKYAKAGIIRFEQDIKTSGADRVFVLHGINDIIHPDGVKAFRPLSDLPTAEELIDGYRKYIEIAHKHDMKIYFATVLPFFGWRTYNDEKNAIREKVNNWIRNNNESDGYIEFADKIADVNNNLCLMGRFDSGDHLHPSFEGGKFLASVIPLEYLD